MLPPLPPPPPMDALYTSSANGLVYLFNTSRATFRGALAACNAWGGTLVQVGPARPALPCASLACCGPWAFPSLHSRSPVGSGRR